MSLSKTAMFRLACTSPAFSRACALFDTYIDNGSRMLAPNLSQHASNILYALRQNWKEVCADPGVPNGGDASTVQKLIYRAIRQRSNGHVCSTKLRDRLAYW
eukprot:11862883-Alexandrium_andersonii.AAC.1